MTKDNWHGWTFDRAAQVIDYEPIGYPIDLDRLGTSAAILDFIVQVSHKTWCSAECIAGFIRCLDDIINIQANRCPGGHEA